MTTPDQVTGPQFLGTGFVTPDFCNDAANPETTLTDHTHDHSHHGGDEDHIHDEHAGNIDIGTGETATDAFSETHTDLAVYTIEQLVDDIDNLNTWDSDSVTFSFPTEESDDYIGNWREGTLAEFSAQQVAAALEVMALYGDLIDLEFINSGTDVDAEIRMYNSTIINTAGGAPAGTGIAGDMWIYNYDPATIDGYDLDPGSYQYHLLLHEMGHIMGLSHTSFIDGDSYADRATYLQNNAAFSQMSYLTAGSAGLAWDTGYASTPMVVDVAALQALYGANMTTRTGDTIYGFNATAERQAFDFDSLLEAFGEIGAITIWDAGGNDTLDMSGFGEDGFINLADGSHSSVGGHDLNVAIAYNAVIENAIGGSGDDTLLGNEVKNRLVGGLGQDTLSGGAGNDRLYGDTQSSLTADFTHGFATLSGAQALTHIFDGTDVTALTPEMLISFDPEATSASWLSDMPGDWIMVYDPSNQGLWFRTDGQWSLTDLRHADFADGALHRISITYDGVSGTVQFYLDGELRTTIEHDGITALDLGAEQSITFDHEGRIADLRIFDDLRSAEDIRDNAFIEIDPATDGLLSNVTFTNGQAVDVTDGTTVNVTNGVVFGTETVVSTDDVLLGGEGHDLLIGGAGGDTLNGGAGSDTADYGASGSAVVVDLGSGTAQGGDAQGDQLILIERLSGSSYGDHLHGDDIANVLNGGGGSDVLAGAAGKDKLVGGRGHDTLFGGTDNDRLTGGRGADTFVFALDGSRDKIVDFELDKDVIVFGSGLTFDDLVIQDTVNGSQIKFEGTKVLVAGVSADDLDASQFVFEDDLIAIDTWDELA